MTVFISLLAAAAFALATVLMQRGTLETSAAADDPRFYVQILRRPVWLLGALLSGVGGVLHLKALSLGPIVLVEPILTLSVVISLPLGVWLTGQHIGRREYVGAFVVVGGLIGFTFLSQTSGGVSLPSVQRWLAGAGMTICLIAALLWRSRGSAPAIRAGLLGTAAGTAFGLAAAFDKAFVNQINFGPALLQWSLYALIIASVGGGVIQQAALKVGVLAPAMAGVDVANLLIGVALGLLVFEEQMAHGNGRLAGAFIALAIIALGVVTLTRATAAQAEHGDGAPASPAVTPVARPSPD